MNDVAPALLEAITDEVTQGIGSSSKIQSVLALIQNGKATHADSLFYARETGEILAKAFKTNLSSAVLPDGRMYYNIAQRILEPTLTNNHNLVADVATEVQSILNEQAGIGLKAIRPAVNQSGIDGIVNKVSLDMPFDNVAWILQDPIVRFSEHVVDETIQKNVEFIGESGIATTITRTIDSGACKWCRDIAGTYTYPNIPDDVYRRHDNCHCLVVSKTGKNKKVIHSGKEGNRKYEKGEISGKYQRTEEERAKILKEKEATAEARAKAARQKRIETWEKKKQEKQAYDVRGIERPKRPSFRDYPGGTSDENFIRDRAAYKRKRETYDVLMNQQVDRSLKRKFNYNTPERVLAAGRERGIEIDPLLLDGKKDFRAFDELFESYDELREKYPQAMKYEFDYEGRTIPSGVNRIMKSEANMGQSYYAAFEGDTLLLGDGMLESYEDNMRQYLESITDGFLSQGNGTYKNLFNHEFGHNVDSYIHSMIRSGKEAPEYLSKMIEYENGLKKLYADYGPPSEYGKTNLAEFFAETFSAYEGGEQTDLTRAFGKFLEGWL